LIAIDSDIDIDTDIAMVEESKDLPQLIEALNLGSGEEVKMEDMVRLLNDPRYLETAEAEIEKAI